MYGYFHYDVSIGLHGDEVLNDELLNDKLLW